MLKVQEWLLSQNGNFSLLKEQLGIDATFHPTDDRVILNYCQIDSAKHKTNQIVRECRALTLNKNDYSLIARGFGRFFNLGECIEDDKKLDWNNCVIQEKMDGSLILCYHWQNAWRIQTRASFGQGKIQNELEHTWESLVRSTVDVEFLDPAFTHVFELCSLYNKVVRNYPSPTSYLLTLFYHENELTLSETDFYADLYGLERPQTFTLKNIDEVNNHIVSIAKDDPTFEGVVVRDKDNNRCKVKNDKYLALHRLKNNGNLPLLKNIIPLVFSGDESEILIYFPEYSEIISSTKNRINEYREQLKELWKESSQILNQKEFALRVKDTKLSSFLFHARRYKVDPVEYFDKSPEMVLKLLS